VGADIAERDGDVFRTHSFADDVQRLDRQPFRVLNARSSGGAQAELKLTGGDTGKNLASQLRDQQEQQRGHGHGIDGHNGLAPAEAFGKTLKIFAAEAVEAVAALRFRERMMTTQKPDRQHRHQRGRQKKRRDHGEADRHGKRHKQRARHAGHQKRWHKHRQDGEHRQQLWRQRGFGGVEHGAGDGGLNLQLAMDRLDRDGGLVDQDADRQGEAAERHHIDGLAGRPQPNHCAQQRERDGDHDNGGAAPVLEKQQHHQAGQARANQPLVDQRLQRVGHKTGLVEGQLDRYIGGQHGANLR